MLSMMHESVREYWFACAAIVVWLLWVWVYNFAIGGIALWKALLGTAVFPAPAAAMLIVIAVVRHRRTAHAGEKQR
jgi:hypothetical protein